MKRIILLAAILMGITLNSHAQEPMFNKGDRILNLGVGLGNSANISVSVEQCVVDQIFDKGSIGIGLYGGAGWLLFSGANDAIIVGGVRGTFHYPVIEKFDTYIGFATGLRYRAWNLGTTYTSQSLGADGGGFVGGRYFLSEKFTVFGEIGFSSLGYLTAGVSFSF